LPAPVTLDFKFPWTGNFNFYVVAILQIKGFYDRSGKTDC
jgi:hypothetical protein